MKRYTISFRTDRIAAGHIRNRSKRLGLTIGQMVVRAVMRTTDLDLVRPLGEAKR